MITELLLIFITSIVCYKAKEIPKPADEKQALKYFSNETKATPANDYVSDGM